MGNKVKDILKGFAWGLLFCAVITMCSSCSHTKYVTVPEVHETFIHQTDTFLRHDSTYVHDSIWMRIAGDTVFVEKFKTKYVASIQNVFKHDTIVKRDSIPYTVYEIKKVTKTDYTGWIAFAIMTAIFCSFLYFVIKK